MLKEAGPSIAYSLTKLINLSLTTGMFPNEWKKANVLPLFKKGDKKLIGNYRPVSLTSCISKIAERVIFKYLYNYLNYNNIISKFQSGFKPGDSTEYQLLDFHHILCEALDKGKDVRVVFFDIAKAFDKVWHEGLIYKLRMIGVGGLVLDWFQNYMSKRKQRVVLGNNSSAFLNIPQGSVLGPLSFLIYINDITTVVKSQIRLFADDTTLFLNVDKLETSVAAADNINNDLNNIGEWARQWLVTFSPPKTKTITFTN
jgi:hypothetical protein